MTARVPSCAEFREDALSSEAVGEILRRRVRLESCEFKRDVAARRFPRIPACATSSPSLRKCGQALPQRIRESAGVAIR